jgi:hypothetical protein
MKKYCLSICFLLLLAGCQHSLFRGNAVIDWVDFIKWDGISYDGIRSGVLSDETFIGEKIGTVQFKVSDNVTNPNYKTKNGDAAFHEKGTEIYSIKGAPHLLAVKSEHTINGYDVYFAREDTEYKWHFKDMPMDRVTKVEIYQSPTVNNEQYDLISNLNNAGEVREFLNLLQNSEEKPDFQPNMENGDPTYYEMIFYIDGEPIAYKYNLAFDGATYFWYPWDTSVISGEIGSFLDSPNN